LNAKFRQSLAAIPEGASRRCWQGRPYITSKQTLQDGRLVKLYAEALDAKDHVSFNLYRLEKSDELRPCEMSDQKVIDFVQNSIALS